MFSENVMPLEEAIKYMKFARNHEEYWQMTLSIAAWKRRNPERDRKSLGHFLGSFVMLYLFNHRLPYNRPCFDYVRGSLAYMADGKCPDDPECKEIIDHLKSYRRILSKGA